MNNIKELIRIHQEYEYFTKQMSEDATDEAYALLKENPLFQSSYMEQVFTQYDKRRSTERIAKIKQNLSQKIFWGVLLCLILAAFSLILM